jgi:hypothetical protein
MAGIPTPGQSLAQLTIANGWPAEWFEMYNRENLCTADPVPRHCFNTLNPFEWKDAPYDHEHDVAAHTIMTRARLWFLPGILRPDPLRRFDRRHQHRGRAAVSRRGDQERASPHERLHPQQAARAH